MIRTRIAGLGHYLPERVLTNADLEKMVETSDQWIRDRTGIEERHIAAPDETSSTLGLCAARIALADAGIEGADIDLVIAATTTPDGFFPSVASLIQGGIGASNAGAFDVNSACVGFLAALSTGFQFVATGAAKRVLVVGTEVLSRIGDWQDRNTCVLFGDGAGALVLEAAAVGGALGSLFTPPARRRPGSAPTAPAASASPSTGRCFRASIPGFPGCCRAGSTPAMSAKRSGSRAHRVSTFPPASRRRPA